MAQQQVRVDETIVDTTLESDIVKNVNIPSNLPPAERVVSVNARVEITTVEVENGYVVLNGVIRSTIYYASADDPSNVVSIRRNFTFTDRITVRRARPGLDVEAEVLISDIDFNLINERTIGLEFTVVTDLQLTAPDTVNFIEERPDLDIRTRRIRIKRSVRERNYPRELEAIKRISTDKPDIGQVIDVDSSIQILEVTTDYDRVHIKGVVNSDLLYENEEGQIEYDDITYGFNESFVFSGVTPDNLAFVETNITDEKATKVDERRVKINTDVFFTILVVAEELVEIPTDIISPDGRIYPVRRVIIVERVVVEERTRIQARGQTTIPEANPDIGRIISVSGNIRGNSLEVEAQEGGVSISGIIDANIIYVADEPQQPVYFAPATITFSTFLDLPEVSSDMQAYADVTINRISGSRISDRQISVRAVLDVNLLVTERVRIPVITGTSEQPVQEPSEPGPYITYVVKSGDTLYLIGQKFGVSVNRLIQINNISDPGQLQVGQRILIPR